jgi:hypothetical protein
MLPVESPAQVSIEEESFDQGTPGRYEAFLRAIREGTSRSSPARRTARVETAMQIRG